MVVEGEEVQASLTPHGDALGHDQRGEARRHTGVDGTASIGGDTSTELDERRERGLGDPGELYIVDQLEIGMTAEPVTGDDGLRRATTARSTRSR